MQIGAQESSRRLYEKLNQDLGSEIITLLIDKDVNEIMLNPDGKLWVDRISCGQVCVSNVNLSRAYAIINAIAGIHGFVISQYSPQLEAELPHHGLLRGERFTAQIPPIVPGPCFTIRKKAEVVFTLAHYLESGRINEAQFTVLRELVVKRKNILVCGGPGTGKTTFTNALIDIVVEVDPNQRFLLLEDLPELQCKAINKVSMLTAHNLDMTSLLKTAMRMRPDRILIGEVRGAEALTLLKAWNTGCPGGICTLHANGAIECVQRVLDLAMESGLTVPPIQLVLHTIDAIVALERNVNQKGFVREIVTILEYQNGEFKFKKLA